jgi:hypothetical protein
MRLRLLSALFLWVIAQNGFSQSLFDERTDRFAFEVKQVDEFIDRFNNKDNILLKKYILGKDPAFQFDRIKLLLSLFNLDNKNWKEQDIRRFAACVTDSNHPVYLSFYDNDWFAELKCSVLYKGKEEKIRLIMQVQKEKDNASRWVIAGVEASFYRLPKSVDSTTSLNPMSHATDFLGLDRIWEDRKNTRNYLPAHFEPNALSVFIHELRNNTIQLKQVDSITYHFLQVKGWAFTLDNFRRSSRNSGWLVSKLIPCNDREKLAYKSHVLNLPSYE